MMEQEIKPKLKEKPVVQVGGQRRGIDTKRAEGAELRNKISSPEASQNEQSSKKPKTHVSEEKKELVRSLAELMKKKTVMVISIKNLPSAQFQDIKKKLRDKVIIQVTKKSLVDFALEHCGIKELHDLVPYVQDSTAMLFSDNDAFEISAILSESKSSAKAKEGQEAPEEIVVNAGPTSLMPGPDISALSAVGLQPKVEEGKIHIVKDAVLCKKGEKITPEKVSVLAKLDITPFKIGLEPIAAYMNGKVYVDIKVDKETALEEIKELFGKAIAFAVSVDYVNKNTLTYILGKAGAHKKAIECLIKEEPAEEKPAEEKPVEPSDVGDNGGDTKSAEGAENSKISSPEASQNEPKTEEKVPTTHELAKKMKEKEDAQENKSEGSK